MTDLLALAGLCVGATFAILGVRWLVERLTDALRARAARRRGRPVLVLYVTPWIDVDRYTGTWTPPPRQRRDHARRSAAARVVYEETP